MDNIDQQFEGQRSSFLELQQSLHSETVKGVSRYDAKTIAEIIALNPLTHPQVLESEYSFSIYRDLRDSFHFQEDVIGTNDYVSMYANGTPKSEPAKLVTNGVVDIGILHSVLRPEVNIKLSYLHPTHKIGKVTAFFKEPQASFSHDVYTDPFQASLWITIICTWVGIVAIFLISTKLFKKKYQKHHNQFDGHEYSAADVISWGFSGFTQQGWDLDVPAMHLQIVALSGRLTTTVIYGAYCGAIISVLSLDLPDIVSLQDLITKGFVFESYRPSASMGAYLRDFLSHEKIEQEEFMIDKSQVMDSLDSLEPRKAFLYYWPSFYQIVKENNVLDWIICETISAIPIDRHSIGSAMVVRKDYKYRELFNYKIINLKENGLNRRYQKVYERNAIPHCPKEDRLKKKRSLSLSEVQFAFLFVIFANVICPAILVLEIVIHSVHSKVREVSVKFAQGK